MDDSAYYADLDDYDDAGVGSILYPLSICFAVGIWLVVQRYHSIRNRAVPFRVRIPEVRSIAPHFVNNVQQTKLSHTSVY